MIFVGIPVACVKAYSTFIQLCSDGFHQDRHRGGGACDVGGARVNHSCAASRTKHHLHPHRNTGGIEEADGKDVSPFAFEWVRTHTQNANTHTLFNL